jgi:hypothetical protein
MPVYRVVNMAVKHGGKLHEVGAQIEMRAEDARSLLGKALEEVAATAKSVEDKAAGAAAKIKGAGK